MSTHFQVIMLFCSLKFGIFIVALTNGNKILAKKLPYLAGQTHFLMQWSHLCIKNNSLKHSSTTTMETCHRIKIKAILEIIIINFLRYKIVMTHLGKQLVYGNC